MADTFKPGDKVRLKSGGPVMTISEMKMPERYQCKWFTPTQFTDAQRLESLMFNETDLEMVESDSTSTDNISD